LQLEIGRSDSEGWSLSIDGSKPRPRISARPDIYWHGSTICYARVGTPNIPDGRSGMKASTEGTGVPLKWQGRNFTNLFAAQHGGEEGGKLFVLALPFHHPLPTLVAPRSLLQVGEPVFLQQLVPVCLQVNQPAHRPVPTRPAGGRHSTQGAGSKAAPPVERTENNCRDF